jgi:hypothetical protein
MRSRTLITPVLLKPNQSAVVLQWKHLKGGTLMNTKIDEHRIPTDAEYLAEVRRDVELWVNNVVRPEYKKRALRQNLRGARVLARHFISRRKELKGQGYSDAEAHAIAIEERDLVRSRSDFDRIFALVRAGVSFLKAIDLVEPLRVLDEEIAQAESDVEMTAEQLEPVRDQVDDLEDRIEGIYDDIETLKRNQVIAWEELAVKHIQVTAQK